MIDLTWLRSLRLISLVAVAEEEPRRIALDLLRDTRH
jgi:hypothetical protein